ncbi:MAG: glycosyltransferase family 1 protein [Patescibacteria group bacterium]
MKIAVDANEANVTKKVGISEYAFELIKQFEKLQTSNYNFQIYLKDRPSSDFPPQGANWHYKIFGPKKLWTQFALPVSLFFKKDRPDVFFSLTHYGPRFSPVPTVISIMDLAFFHFPEYFTAKDLNQLKSWTGYSVRNAKAIITISEASKNDIIKWYGIDGSRIHVIYPGIKPTITLTPHIYSMEELQTKYKISKNYILFVGTLQPRKNITRLIEAFSLLIKKKPHTDSDLQLVIVGKKGWKYEEILEAPQKYGVEDRVTFVDFVTDEDLILFYKNALCFAWPSLYEGFGLPILEAMKLGCPVVTSNVSSLPEAGGDAVLYVDPEDVSDITDKLDQVASDPRLRKTMIEKGHRQVQKFSWEKSAKETLAVLEQVVKNK